MPVDPPPYVSYPRAATDQSLDELRELVATFNRTNQTAFAYICILAFSMVVGSIGGLHNLLLAGVCGVVMLFVAIYYLLCAISSARMGARFLGISPIVSIPLMLVILPIPFAALVYLLVIQSRVNARFQTYGIRPRGLALPKDEIEALEHRMTPNAKLAW